MPKPQKLKRKDGRSDGRLTSPPTPASGETELDPFENFDIELLWCIQQLESSFKVKKMNPRTAEDVMKNLNTLKSSKAPLIKKRQVMRNVFGDYRAKMAEEEKKLYKANSNLKFISSSDHNKSKFLKMSTHTSMPDQVAISCDPSGNISEEILCGKVTTSETSDGKATKQLESKSFSFKPSDNQFRFKFFSSEEDPKS